MIVSAVPQIPKPALRIMLPLLISFTASSASLNNFEPPRFFGGACDAGRSEGVTSELKVASDRLTRLGRSVDLLSKADERQSCLRVRREQLAIGMLALMVTLLFEAKKKGRNGKRSMFRKLDLAPRQAITFPVQAITNADDTSTKSLAQPCNFLVNSGAASNRSAVRV